MFQLTLNISDVLFKNYNSTLEFEVCDVPLNGIQIPSVLRQIQQAQPLHCHPEELKINKRIMSPVSIRQKFSAPEFLQEFEFGDHQPKGNNKKFRRKFQVTKRSPTEIQAQQVCWRFTQQCNTGFLGVGQNTEHL